MDVTVESSVTNDDESTLPPHVFGFASKKKKIYFENLKKKSYEPRRNFLQTEIVKISYANGRVSVRYFRKII